MDSLLPYLPGIGLGYTVFLVSMISPGPNLLAVLGTSMAEGRKAGVALALGVAAGSLTWGLLSLSGLTALLSLYAQALTVLKIAGGLYLLWLAYKAFRSAMTPADLHANSVDAGDYPPAMRFAARGYAIQMTNPKAALAWVAIISVGMQDGATLNAGLAIVLGCAMLSVMVYCGYAVAFSTQRVVRLYARGRRGIQAGLGVVFGFAGFRLLNSRI